jgi:hypothetical protein
VIENAPRAPEVKRVAELMLQGHAHILAHAQGRLQRSGTIAPCLDGRSRRD